MARDKICTPFLALSSPENKFTVNTIEDMQSRKYLKIGDVVELNGYYTAGDGAGHKRKIEATDDGSGVQLANGLWANIAHNGEVNVSWFGAKGDGITDDTGAVQKALNLKKVITGSFEKKYRTGKLYINKAELKNIKLYETSFEIGEKVRIFNIEIDVKKDNESVFCLDFLKNYSVKRSIFISTITLYGEIKDFKKDLILIKLPHGAGVFDVVFEKFKSELVQWGRVVAIEAEVENREYPAWLTFTEFNDFSIHGFVKGVEIISYKKGNEENKYDWEELTATPVLRPVFNSFHLEAKSTMTEHGIYFGRGTRSAECSGIFLGDFHLIGDDLFWITIEDRDPNLKIDSLRIEKQYHQKILFRSGKKGDLNLLVREIIDFGDYYKMPKHANHNLTTGTVIYNHYINTDHKKLILCKLKENEQNNLKILFFDKTSVSGRDFLGLNILTTATNELMGVWCENSGGIEIKVSLIKKDDSYFVVMDILPNVKYFNTVKTAVTILNSFVSDENIIEVVDTNYFAGSVIVSEKIAEEVIKSIALINTPYHATKMQQEGVYDDFIQYMDEKTEYDRVQRELEQQRQLAFENRENQGQTYDEWLSQQPMLLPADNEPQPSEALLAFKTKYLG